jgi:hypothetical protein
MMFIIYAAGINLTVGSTSIFSITSYSPRRKISSMDRLIKGIPVLAYMLRLDPRRANRNVDDRILNETGVFDPKELDLKFKIYVDGKEKIIDASNGIDDINFNPVNKKERQNESEKISPDSFSAAKKGVFRRLIGAWSGN